MRLILDIGQYEYIPKIGEAAGAVIVVHPSDQMPFPEDQGIVIKPGMGTAIAIKAVRSQMKYSVMVNLLSLMNTVMLTKIIGMSLAHSTTGVVFTKILKPILCFKSKNHS